MATFEIAYGITKRIEGGWHGGTGANSSDRGGETYKGIARKIWPNWTGWQRIDFLRNQNLFPMNLENDQLLQALVPQFYQKEFWNILRLSDIKSQAIANELFDTSVNVGSRQGALWLQRSLNLLNRGQKSWRDIQVDGIIGNGTLGVVNGLNEADTKSLFNILNGYQARHYIDLAEKDPRQEDFIRGWFTRVELMR